jgi:hypothetical protein
MLAMIQALIPRRLKAVEEARLAEVTALAGPCYQREDAHLDFALFGRVLGGLSAREYEAAAEPVPEAFGLARSSVSRRFGELPVQRRQCQKRESVVS